MRVASAEYVKSFVSIQDFDLPVLPAVAFIGRSNVGKSSLINHLLNRHKLVKTSSTPGKTQLLNFFLINNQFYIVDLPGYGFADVPVNVKSGWLNMIRGFLAEYPALRLVVQLVDVRHKPSADDRTFNRLLAENGWPSLVIANKSDKVKKNSIKKSLAEIQTTLGLSITPLLHSSLQKTGSEAIWARIQAALSDGSE